MSDFSDDEDGEVQTDRVNIGIANGPTDSSVTPLRVIQAYTVWVNSGRAQIQ